MVRMVANKEAMTKCHSLPHAIWSIHCVNEYAAYLLYIFSLSALSSSL